MDSNATEDLQKFSYCVPAELGDACCKACVRFCKCRSLWDFAKNRCTRHDAATLPKLFAKIVRFLFGGKLPVCRATFRKIVLENLDAEGLHLLGIAVDHNKCHICKLY